MTDLRRRRVFVYFLLGAFLLYIVIKSVAGISATNEAMRQRLPSTYQLRLEDSLLFNEANRRKLTTIEVQNSTLRHPISLITYADEYSLIVHPLDIALKSLTKGFIHVQNESMKDVSTGVPYAIVDNNAFKFRYSVKANGAVSQVYLTLHGDSVHQIMQNDSMVCYGLQCKDLSVRYGEDKPIDLHVKADKYFSAGVPLSILFYKKSNRLYFLLLSPNKKRNIDPQLLPSLVLGT
jgi:hypothetical protein